ncbi:peptide chain release factor N(5)-glutamine methyltransferase [Candidatus Chrysopegis kryptomonas]|uniref:Release factor glutamine methyltransferase n=1 Tax=Candidatus Chryseopegocella kryptomonas TaxID=1633643 RepID=A0A0P1MZV1_9BACT|nr:peptide chain release factor N(5)-glutamine methyltransferase [Candidatus Chrysopegis kryptomonas]CUT01781.1 release factor glutamine methyltransferase [Candidatus Chrysopegis kryptomonas]
MTETKIWRIIDIINWGTEFFKSKGITHNSNGNEARTTIELILCHVLKCRRIDLYIDFERPLSKNELEEIKTLIKRRLKREPLQYILGKTEFMGLEFKLTPDVLIPRPETEILVEKTIETIKKEFAQKNLVKVLDIGTGSGNIAISLAKFLGEKVYIVGIDISEKAIEVANENAKLNKVENVKFLAFDLFSDEFNEKFKNQFDIIVSNPPYISIEEVQTLQDEIKNYEPWIAITDGADGLNFFRRISNIAKNLIFERGFVLVEMAYNQSEKVREIFTKAGFKEIEFFKDYLGIERVAKIKVEKL